MSGKTLTKAEIVDAIYEKTDRNRAEVKGVVESLLGIMKQAIKKDHALLISGFGKFEAYDKKARKGRNPQTDESWCSACRASSAPNSTTNSAFSRTRPATGRKGFRRRSPAGGRRRCFFGGRNGGEGARALPPEGRWRGGGVASGGAGAP